MKTTQANLINSFTLIILSFWGYLDTGSGTAFIPFGFGLFLLLCHNGLKKENKIIAHVAVLLTLILLIALVVMRLPKSLDAGGIGLYRVIFMIITSFIAMLTFIQSFIKARRK
tara:strand:- start:1139 stop:1477 length:339 start_codon:yes stop_codon:yes gene_type:complete